MDFSLSPEQEAIKSAIERICARFPDDYWLAKDSEGSLVSQAFIYTAPCFYFKPHEQELLCHALIGYSDDELADPLGVSLAAVRKRWAAIYERVAAIDPDLLPSAGDGTRGAEKRRDLLAYLRDHPEELRPVEPPPKERVSRQS